MPEGGEPSFYSIALVRNFSGSMLQPASDRTRSNLLSTSVFVFSLTFPLTKPAQLHFHWLI